MIFLFFFLLILSIVYVRFKEKVILGEYIYQDEYKSLINDLRKLTPKEMDKLVLECNDWLKKKSSR